MSFKDTKCIVTGGTKGIGRAVVQAFAEEGAKVLTCARKQEDLDSMIKEMKDAGHNVEGFVCDVGNSDSIKAFMIKALEIFDGKLDVLVNNAGTNVVKQFVEHTDEDFNTLINTNVRSVVQFCQFAHPMLKANGEGSVVIVGSIAGGSRALKNESLYGMTKAAMDMATKCLACEWAPDNIRVNCLAPGVIETPLTAQMTENPDMKQAIQFETPMKRVGRPEEIARPILFLCSSAASFVTGHVLNVDGGMSIRGLGN